MKRASLIPLVLAFATLLCAQNTTAASDTAAFDGAWSVTVDYHEYKNPDGTVAKAAVNRTQAEVKNGVLHAEYGTKGAAAWWELDGKIAPDGTANLRMSGMTGKSDYTPFNLNPGVKFGYQVIAHFDGRHGTGMSVGDPRPPRAPRTRIYTFVKE